MVIVVSCSFFWGVDANVVFFSNRSQVSEQQQQKTELIQPGTQIDVPPPVKPKKREKMDVDALLKKLGQPGLYHLLVTLLLYMAEFPVAVSHLSAAIHTARIPHHCRLPAGFNLTTSVPLQSDGTYRRVPHDAYPANTFVQWADVVQMLYKCFVFSGYTFLFRRNHSQETLSKVNTFAVYSF